VNIRWKTEIPGLAHSSPVIWGDRVFITTAISSDPKAVFRHGLFGDVEPSSDVSKHSWRVYALDKASGKIVWERTAHEGVPRTKRHPKSSQASSTPVTDGKHVVAFLDLRLPPPRFDGSCFEAGPRHPERRLVLTIPTTNGARQLAHYKIW
jgi:outer membrane protein assembly factor BamB